MKATTVNYTQTKNVEPIVIETMGSYLLPYRRGVDSQRDLNKLVNIENNELIACLRNPGILYFRPAGKNIFYTKIKGGLKIKSSTAF